MQPINSYTTEWFGELLKEPIVANLILNILLTPSDKPEDHDQQAKIRSAVRLYLSKTTHFAELAKALTDRARFDIAWTCCTPAQFDKLSEGKREDFLSFFRDTYNTTTWKKASRDHAASLVRKLNLWPLPDKKDFSSSSSIELTLDLLYFLEYYIPGQISPTIIQGIREKLKTSTLEPKFRSQLEAALAPHEPKKVSHSK